jgi:hypothetical protein
MAEKSQALPFAGSIAEHERAADFGINELAVEQPRVGAEQPIEFTLAMSGSHPHPAVGFND